MLYFRSAQRVADILGCNTTDSQEIVDCLRQVDAQTLDGFTFFGFMPVVDGDFIRQVHKYHLFSHQYMTPSQFYEQNILFFVFLMSWSGLFHIYYHQYIVFSVALKPQSIII